MGWIYRGLRRCQPVLLPTVDVLAWAVLLYVVSLVRFDLQPPQIILHHFAVMVVIAAVFQCALGYGTVLYRTKWKVGSFEEARALALTVVGTTGVLLVYDIGFRRHTVPLSAVVVSGAGVFMLAGGYRALWRMVWEYRNRPASALPVIVYGAGIGGQQVLRALLSDPASPYYPVVLLDDDAQKQNLRIRHLRVAGRGTDLGRVAAATGASAVIIAIPSAGSELVREVAQRAVEAGLSVLTLPTVSQLLSSTVGI